MFITRKEFERRIKKAKKKATEKAMVDMSMRNEMQDVRREMYRITENMNTAFDKELKAVEKDIARIKKELRVE
ncbi:MAG: hypothetical protein ACLS3T_04410 [Anaerobutyricum sp.]|jgi:hypothetical protein